MMNDERQTFSENTWIGFLLFCTVLSAIIGWGTREDEVKSLTDKVERYKLCNEKLTLECLKKEHTIENMEINRILAGRPQYPIALPWGKLYKDTPSIAQVRKDIRERARKSEK